MKGCSRYDLHIGAHLLSKNHGSANKVGDLLLTMVSYKGSFSEEWGFFLEIV